MKKVGGRREKVVEIFFSLLPPTFSLPAFRLWYTSAIMSLLKKPPALLALEDGTVYYGYAFGYPGKTVGEVVFNTAMTGYQEILTDPSYHGQIVTMTYPHIGNYGVSVYDMESNIPYAKGFIVREFSRIASSHRSNGATQNCGH
jgi:Carbamoyl-phosphate synthase small chain, CPSase domain